MKTYIIKNKINEKDLTIREVSELLKMHEQTITNWINKRNLSNIDKFLQLLKLLEIDINELY